jgi:hypothetical protein
MAAKCSDAGGGCTADEDAMKAKEPGSPQQKGDVSVVALEEEAEECPASRAIYGKSSGTAQGAVVQRTTTDDDPPSPHGKSNGMAQDAAVQRMTAAKRSEAGGKAAVVAFQAAVAAKSSEAGGGTVGENVTKAQEPGSPLQEEGVVGVAPEEEEAAKEDSTSEAMHSAPGAEHAGGGGMKSGG